MQDSSFVNPYSFVQLPARVLRTAPSMHSGPAGDLLCGSITITWHLRTPLLLPKNAEPEGWLTRGKNGVQLSLPGSSIKGAVRSVHEAMFNGCLRVVDEEFTPSYRMAAREGTEAGWRLARVTQHRGGTPTEVQLCDAESEVWVDATALYRVWPSQGDQSLPTSGDVIRLSGEVRPTSLGRDEMRIVSGVDRVALDSSEARLLLVTSTQARHAYRIDPDTGASVKGKAYWATAVLTQDLATVTPSAAQRFAVACAGSDDRRKLQVAKTDEWRSEGAFESVDWWGPRGNKQPIARRRMASGLLFSGDPVWVKLGAAGEVVDLRLAQIWRLPGAGAMWKRFGTPREDPRFDSGALWPTRLHSCRFDDTGLCLTCSIFGAADTTQAEKGEDRAARQRSYGAHVRFGSAVGEASELKRVARLAPMGAPHPGAGMFYLLARPLKGGRPRADVATRWGVSKQDEPLAPMAGRKFYWHSDPDAQAEAWSATLRRKVPPRYEASSAQAQHKPGSTKEGSSKDMVREAYLVPAGTTLTGTVAFDRLDAVQLESLLAALDPARLLAEIGREDSEFAVHLGGGKPFGLGSATVEITVDAERVANRYSAEPQAFTPADRTPRAAIEDRVGPLDLTALAAMLDLNALGEDAALMAYPPGAPWSDYRNPNDTNGRFEQSCEFFGWANGEVEQGGVRPWFPLAAPAWGTDQKLPIPPAQRGRGRR